MAPREARFGQRGLRDKLVLRCLVSTLGWVVRAPLGCVSCLVELTMRHVEEIVHDEGRVCALKVVLGVLT